MIEHKLKLKFDDSFNGILFSTQGDTGRVFEVEVRDELDNAIDIAGHKLEFYVGNESKVTKVEASISGNKFVVRPVNEQFTKSGLNKAQFVLYDKQGLQVGSQIFDLHVEESIQQGATVGSNVVVDFGILQEALKLIKGYEKTFEESKGLDATLNASIEEGRKVDQALKSDTSAARGVDANLKTSTTKASEAYTKLEATRGSADTLNTDLKSNISQGNKTNANLQSSIGTATSTQNTLQDKTAQGIEINTKLGQSIKTGQNTLKSMSNSEKNMNDIINRVPTISSNLMTTISDSETAKTKLDESIGKANTAKSNLDTSTSKGNTTDTKLKETDAKAGASISTLRDLLNKSSATEQSLKEIIASGNLDKYVTTPKLEEALAKIKTLKKEVVQSLPATGQDDVIYLVKDSKGKANNVYLEYLWINGAFELIGSTEVDLSGYAKASELDEKLAKSQITDKYDLNDKTKVPSSKALYDAIGVIDELKVDKAEGKGLSSNDYTNDEKTLVSKILDIEEQARVALSSSYGVIDDIDKMADKVDSINELASQVGNLAYHLQEGQGKLQIEKADRTEIKTKLSQMIDDSTHRLVTDAEKEKWNSGGETGYERIYMFTSLDGFAMTAELVKVGKVVHVYIYPVYKSNLSMLKSLPNSWKPEDSCGLGIFRYYDSSRRQLYVANVRVDYNYITMMKQNDYPKSYQNTDILGNYQYIGSYITK